MTTESIVGSTIGSSLSNPTKLAQAGRIALAGAKFVGSAALTGVIMGTGAGITVAVGIPVFMGTYKLITHLGEKVSQKFESKKVDAAGPTPSPA